MVQAPIFHVNADDPQMVAFVAKVAFEYRMRFGKDVVIDLVCYRKHGHNEADEPFATQPMMYQKIKKHQSCRSLYVQHLIATEQLNEHEAQEFATNYRKLLEHGEPVQDIARSNERKK